MKIATAAVAECIVRYKQKRTAWKPSFRRDANVRELSNGDVRGLQALGALDHVELHCCTLGQGAEALRLDRREMHENVFATLGGDEAEALRIVEPLDCAGRTHLLLISFVCFPCFGAAVTNGIAQTSRDLVFVQATPSLWR